MCLEATIIADRGDDRKVGGQCDRGERGAVVHEAGDKPASAPPPFPQTSSFRSRRRVLTMTSDISISTWRCCGSVRKARHRGKVSSKYASTKSMMPYFRDCGICDPLGVAIGRLSRVRRMAASAMAKTRSALRFHVNDFSEIVCRAESPRRARSAASTQRRNRTVSRAPAPAGSKSSASWPSVTISRMLSMSGATTARPS